MTKDVFLSISGLQFGQGREDGEKIETVLPGTYYEKGGRHYVLYEESMEGFVKPLKNTIKFCNGFMELNRSGPVNVRMVFEENRKTMTSYQTPYGTILLGIDTKKIHITQDPDRMLVDVVYILDMDGNYLADCNLTIDIRVGSNCSV